jgi:hypothetical protein
MRFIFTIVVFALLIGCNPTIRTIEEPKLYLHKYEEEQKIYYYDGQPYYGYTEGFYYYYGYPHSHSWDLYYKHRPAFWYNKETHVDHEIMYVIPPINGWKFNNNRGGIYKVPKRHQNPSIEKVPYTY